MFHLMDTEFVLSAALLAVLVILLFMYGFHGILKFKSGINYIMAIMFAVLAALACVGVVMAGIKYISDDASQYDEFGGAVSLYGNMILVGSQYSDDSTGSIAVASQLNANTTEMFLNGHYKV